MNFNNKNKARKHIERKLIRGGLIRGGIEISDAEIAYFRENPEELDVITDQHTSQKLFLLVAAGAGFALVLLSKLYELIPDRIEGLMHGLIVDLLFEGGVAIWGGVAAIYLFDILQKKQTDANADYRNRVRQILGK